MKITVARALAELKMLKKRISDGVDDMTVAVTVDGTVSKDVRDQEIHRLEGEIQSVRDLIERYRRIKAAIMRSNSTTIVKIAGEEMTVAEAIARKETRDLSEPFLNRLRNVLTRHEQALMHYNVELPEKISRLAAEASGERQGENFEKFYDLLLAKHKREMIYPDRLPEKVVQWRQQHDAFFAEVDFALAESNTVTVIEIPD